MSREAPTGHHEPWSSEAHVGVVDDDGCIVATFVEPGAEGRAIACVNACAEIPRPEHIGALLDCMRSLFACDEIESGRRIRLRRDSIATLRAMFEHVCGEHEPKGEAS